MKSKTSLPDVNYFGRVFGEFKVISEPYVSDNNRIMVKVDCSCGNSLSVLLQALIARKLTHCGCKEKHLIGTKINRLTVIEHPYLDYVTNPNRTPRRVKVQCECGKLMTVELSPYLRGKCIGCKECADQHHTESLIAAKKKIAINLHKGDVRGGYLVLEDPIDNKIKVKCLKCNKIYRRNYTSLKGNLSQSCGCESRRKSRIHIGELLRCTAAYAIGEIISDFKVKRRFRINGVQHYEVEDTNTNKLLTKSELDLINLN